MTNAKAQTQKAQKTQTVANATVEELMVTKEGLKALHEELEFLQTVRRKQVAERLKEAVSYGDLSENSEYEEAKNEQAFVEGRILELEEKVKHARIITHKHGKVAELGSVVVIKRNISNFSGRMEH